PGLAWLSVTGPAEALAAAFSRLAQVDLSPRRFSDGAIAQTPIPRGPATGARVDEGEANGYQPVCEPPLAGPARGAETPGRAQGELGACLARAERDPEGAYEDAMNWARARGGGDPALHCAAIALFAQGSFRMSAAAFTELAETTRDKRAAIRADMTAQAGHAWMIAGDATNALAAFDAAVEIAPDAAIYHADRAEALAALGQDWDAIDALNRASDLDPNRGEIYAMRASLYRKLNTLDLAAEDANQAVRLAPKLPEAWLERGIVNRLKNDKNAARRDFREVVLLDGDGPVGDAARENIERMELDSGPPVNRRR
ncbi:MAG: hypothetical protein IBJ15_15040, partial [Alphaproteobacteria bacterium]|nr:hypothetical protein [Alphaproteobacteria bacterium]